MNPTATLLKKDWRRLRNLHRLAKEQSRFKLLFITIFAMALTGGLTMLFIEGFKFLDALGGMGLMIIRHLFGIFFLGLGVMLIISNIITSYTTIFGSDEIPFLVLRPISRGTIVVHKLVETAFLSSWAFFFIIIPFIGSYAWHENLSPFFVIATFLFSVPFLMLCSFLGTIITITAVRILPDIRPQIWLAGAILVGSILLFTGTGSSREAGETSFILARMVPGIRLASNPLMPSHWTAEGIMASAKGQWGRAGMFAGVLIANMLLAGLIAEQTGKAWFYAAWQKVLASRRHKKRFKAHLAFSLGNVLFLPRDTTAILLKDIRILLRDPVQWSQGLLFFGLLALYFFNLRNLQRHLLPPIWLNLVAFLNIFSLSAVMCSFCSRFVYPQLSLEGQSFWILGLSPTSMGRVLMTKFAGALAGMLIISVSLASASTLMLGVERGIGAASLMIATAMSLSLCGLATGLGAIFLDLKQRNPAAIISGFGGTLNLALSLIFMCMTILPFGVLYHAHYSDKINISAFRSGLTIASAWLIMITAVTTIAPLAAGRKSLIKRDY